MCFDYIFLDSDICKYALTLFCYSTENVFEQPLVLVFYDTVQVIVYALNLTKVADVHEWFVLMSINV